MTFLLCCSASSIILTTEPLQCKEYERFAAVVTKSAAYFLENFDFDFSIPSEIVTVLSAVKFTDCKDVKKPYIRFNKAIFFAYDNFTIKN